MPRHIVRLVFLMAIIGVVGYGAKRYFTAYSFYEYGHYRGDSVAEIAADKPKYKGAAYCESCHTQQFAEWSKGVHNSLDHGKVVKCETCHGAAGGRDTRGMFEHVAVGTDHPSGLNLVVPAETTKLCTLCHERIVGRPTQQPQIVVAEHAGTQQCTVCHNAHSPRLGLPVAVQGAPHSDAMAGKVKAAACAGCHGAEGVSENLPGPSLRGQNEPYFIEALATYSTGARDNPMMSAVAKRTSSEDTADLAAYFAGLTCESTLSQESQAASTGQATASTCIACHSASGMSANRSWPNLVGLSKAYLTDTVRAYRDGVRKNVMMSGIAKGLSDTDIDNAAAYYANATCK
jgi:cytochrome c553